MRHTLQHVAINENLPECSACGAVTEFAHAANVGRDGRVYMIFRCPSCSSETKVWRPVWQAMADMLIADE